MRVYDYVNDEILSAEVDLNDEIVMKLDKGILTRHEAIKRTL